MLKAFDLTENFPCNGDQPHKKEGKIMLDQLRSIDKSRLKDRIEMIDAKTLAKLEEALKITFDII